jgi:hypothetical protein
VQNKDHKLRCAVIVNDIGALNIDASLIRQHNVVRSLVSIPFRLLLIPLAQSQTQEKILQL